MKKYFFPALLLALFAVGFTASNEDDESTPSTPSASVPAGYPDDSQAEPNPEIEDSTTGIPNPSTSVEEVDGLPVIRIDLTGIKNAEDVDWMRLYGMADIEVQNVWIEIDGKPKGFIVYNNADNAGTENIPVDIVFTIDNSGSMSQEADAVARDIQAWAEELVNSGLNARFGVVGYDGAIVGAMNITSVDALSEYLNYSSGVNRTRHFGGDDAAQLQAAVAPYRTGGGSAAECGAAAIRFADENFTFRTGANRIYVNFTDEPNQPGGKEDYSVKFFESQTNWPAVKGTVHTVFSDDKRWGEGTNWNYEESPWLISEYTGGTVLFTNASFTGVTLSDLPVSGAMQNSYIIRIGDISDLLDGNPHEIHITVMSADGKVSADKTFIVVFTM